MGGIPKHIFKGTFKKTAWRIAEENCGSSHKGIFVEALEIFSRENRLGNGVISNEIFGSISWKFAERIENKLSEEYLTELLEKLKKKLFQEFFKEVA